MTAFRLAGRRIICASAYSVLALARLWLGLQCSPQAGSVVQPRFRRDPASSCRFDGVIFVLLTLQELRAACSSEASGGTAPRSVPLRCRHAMCRSVVESRGSVRNSLSMMARRGWQQSAWTGSAAPTLQGGQLDCRSGPSAMNCANRLAGLPVRRGMCINRGLVSRARHSHCCRVLRLTVVGQ